MADAKKKSSNKKVKKEIKEIVEKIPEILGKDKDLEQLAPDEPKKFTRPPKRDDLKYKKKVLWSGVILFATLVFVMWLWNARTVIYDVKNGESIEASLWKTARDEFSQIMASINEPGNDELSRTAAEESGVNEIEEAIGELVGSVLLGPSSTTVTTTPNE